MKRDMLHKDDNSCIPNKTCKVDITVDERLSEFLSWCTSEGLYISEKVNELSYFGCEGAWQKNVTFPRLNRAIQRQL